MVVAANLKTQTLHIKFIKRSVFWVWLSAGVFCSSASPVLWGSLQRYCSDSVQIYLENFWHVACVNQSSDLKTTTCWHLVSKAASSLSDTLQFSDKSKCGSELEKRWLDPLLVGVSHWKSPLVSYSQVMVGWRWKVEGLTRPDFKMFIWPFLQLEMQRNCWSDLKLFLCLALLTSFTLPSNYVPSMSKSAHGLRRCVSLFLNDLSVRAVMLCFGAVITFLPWMRDCCKENGSVKSCGLLWVTFFTSWHCNLILSALCHN